MQEPANTSLSYDNENYTIISLEDCREREEETERVRELKRI